MGTAVLVPPRRDAGISNLLVAAAFGLLALAVLVSPVPTTLAVAGAGAGALCLTAICVRRPLLPWSRILVALLLVILFIPIRRYKLPGDAGFSLEPYRVLVALILAGWAAALLVDPRVRLRRSGLELPIGLILLTIIGSVAVNPERAGSLQSSVLKAVTFMISFAIVFYLVVSVVRTRAVLDALVKTLVGGGAVIAVMAVIEARTGFAPFTQLNVVFPFLKQDPSFTTDIARGGAMRAFGTAEHPIALGAALVMIVPLGIYAVRTMGPRWYIPLGALVIGVLSTVSRTGVVMLIVIGVVFLWLRPRETRRLWPVLLPMIVATQMLVPGTLGSLVDAFFPEEGLIAEQEGMAGDCSSSGRVADIGPTLEEVGKKPFLGYGFGTRVTTGTESNACILDNQWLGTLLETGVIGFFGWLWFFARVVRRFGAEAKNDDSARGWLLASIAAGVAAYAAGMLTYDAFSFIQVTYLLFIFVGLGSALLAERPTPLAARAGRGEWAARMPRHGY
jgi:polysaccharide biosynthesis protein PslJ